MLAERKKTRGASRRIGDNGDQPAGDRLETGNGLDLDLGGMDVEVGIMQDLQHLVAPEEAEDRRIRKRGAVLLQLVAKRSGAGEDQLDPVAVTGAADALDQDGVGFFLAVATGKKDHKTVAEGLRLIGLAGDKALIDPVGDDEGGRFLPDGLLKGLTDKFGGIVDRVAVTVDLFPENTVNAAVEALGVHHKHVRGKILGLAVKSGRDRIAERPGDFDGLPRHRKGREQMNDVGALDPLSDQSGIRLCDRDAVLFDVVVQRAEVELFQNNVAVLPLPFLVGANDGNVVAFGLEGADQVHGGDGRSIVFLPENVADQSDFHDVRSPCR